MSKKRVLIYGDSPTCATGFANVTRNIINILTNSGLFDVVVFGINYHGQPHKFNFDIWPAMDLSTGDPYGRKKFCQFASQIEFDYLFINQDTFILDFLPELIEFLKKQPMRKDFKSIVYYPVDSVVKKQWFENIKVCDKLVSYTEFGKNETLLNGKIDNISVIPHGVDTNVFYPLDKKDIDEFKNMYFGAQSSKFIFTNVNRFQQRKDVARTIMAFRYLKEKYDDVLLYLHMAIKDQGGDLVELCKFYGLDTSKDVVFPQNFEPNQGYPLDILNKIYNSSDCIVSTTTSEGFGFSWVEGLACKKPIIVPNHTSFKECLSKDVAFLVDSGNNSSLYMHFPNDNDVVRPLVDVEDMVTNMEYVYQNYNKALVLAENGYNLVHDKYTWDGNIKNMWLDVFNKDCFINNKQNNTTINTKVI